MTLTLSLSTKQKTTLPKVFTVLVPYRDTDTVSNAFTVSTLSRAPLLTLVSRDRALCAPLLLYKSMSLFLKYNGHTFWIHLCSGYVAFFLHLPFHFLTLTIVPFNSVSKHQLFLKPSSGRCWPNFYRPSTQCEVVRLLPHKCRTPRPVLSAHCFAGNACVPGSTGVPLKLRLETYPSHCEKTRLFRWFSRVLIYTTMRFSTQMEIFLAQTLLLLPTLQRIKKLLIATTMTIFCLCSLLWEIIWKYICPDDFH